MFGFNQRGVNEYARIGIETGVAAANPHKLIIMLYEGALVACQSAVRDIEKSDYAGKSAMISKAIMIIESGLRLSLDKKAGGQIAESLDSLYAYMSNRLYAANLKNEAAPIAEVIKLLSDLKSAWEAIEKRQVLPADVPMERKAVDSPKALSMVGA